MAAAGKWLAGGWTIVAAVLAGVGATSGGLERMLRNDRWPSIIALSAIGLAISLAVVVYVSGSKRRAPLIIGGVLFGIGLLVAIVTAASEPSTKERPRVTASFTRGESSVDLQMGIKAQGVKADDAVSVTVEGRVRNDQGELIPTVKLLTANAGPDASGVVDLSFTVPLPEGNFDFVAIAAATAENDFPSCSNARNFVEGCTIVRVPQTQPRPSLTLAWTGTPTAAVASLELRAETLSSARTVGIGVYARKAGSPLRLIYSAVVPPTARGAISSKIDVPVARSYRSVCVIAGTEAPESLRLGTTQRCPPEDPSVVWALSVVPR